MAEMTKLDKYLVSVLNRYAWSRYWVKAEVLQEARVESRVNGRLRVHFKCASCGQEFQRDEVHCDHIDPRIPLTGWVSLQDWIARTFCEKKGLCYLCVSCHQRKTAFEAGKRAQNRKAVKNRRRKVRKQHG